MKFRTRFGVILPPDKTICVKIIVKYFLYELIFTWCPQHLVERNVIRQNSTHLNNLRHGSIPLVRGATIVDLDISSLKHKTIKTIEIINIVISNKINRINVKWK